MNNIDCALIARTMPLYIHLVHPPGYLGLYICAGKGEGAGRAQAGMGYPLVFLFYVNTMHTMLGARWELFGPVLWLDSM